MLICPGGGANNDQRDFHVAIDAGAAGCCGQLSPRRLVQKIQTLGLQVDDWNERRNDHLI